MRFEPPFAQALTSENHWVRLSLLLPWNKIVSPYNKSFKSSEGRPPINGRIVVGSFIIKHMLKLPDGETVQQIQENVFMQYFLGYSSFTNAAPFSPTLFVEIRERLSLEVMNSINELIIAHHFDKQNPEKNNKEPEDNNSDLQQADSHTIATSNQETAIGTKHSVTDVQKPPQINKGKLLMDATVAPQNITFPTDLKLLNAAREKSEELIDKLYGKKLHGEVKPRTYRRAARKEFLNTAKKKSKTAKGLYKATGKQLRFLKRNLTHIDTLLQAYSTFPLGYRNLKYLDGAAYRVRTAIPDAQHRYASRRGSHCKHSPAACAPDCQG